MCKNCVDNMKGQKVKTLFELPIHYLDKNEYEKRWNARIEKAIKKLDKPMSEPIYRMNLESSERTYRRIKESIEKQKLGWKYGTIIGFLLITYDGLSDILFDVVLDDSRQQYNSVRKNPMRRQYTNGEHFRVDDEGTNLKIYHRICETTGRLKKEDLRNYTVDDSMLREIGPFIDYIGICER